jgi:hypothetical protein
MRKLLLLALGALVPFRDTRPGSTKNEVLFIFFLQRNEVPQMCARSRIALELSHPGAKSWKDLGVTTTSTSIATAGMLAALQAYNGGTRFSAEEVPTTGSETSEPNPVLLQEFADESHSPQAPEGYTRGMQDPKHRNQMLRSPFKPSWLVAEKAEMDGLYRRKCWVKVLCSSLTQQDIVLNEVSLQNQAQRRTVR